MRIVHSSARNKGPVWLLTFFACVPVFFTPSAPAAEPSALEAARPSGPSWTRPKPPISWTVEFRYPSAADKETAVEGRLLKVSVTTMGKTTLETIKCTKASFDVWSSDGFAFLANPETGQFDLRGNPFILEDSPGQTPSKTPRAQSSASEPPAYPPQYQDWTGLREFDWIKPELFQGTIKQGTETFHIYAELPEDMLAARQPAAPAPTAAPGRPPAPGRPAAPARPAQKWPTGPLGGLPLRPDIKAVGVNAETRIPRFLQLGEIVREYTFSPVSGSSLELPKPIAKVMKMFGH